MTTFSALAARMDPVPDSVLEAARATFTWRTIDAELAELSFDSVFSEPELAGVRGVTGPRLLTFEARGLTIEIEVSSSGDQRHIVGQLLPPGPAELAVRHANGVAEVSADEMGRFTADGISRGPVSVRCRRDGGDAIETDWISL